MGQGQHFWGVLQNGLAGLAGLAGYQAMVVPENYAPFGCGPLAVGPQPTRAQM